VTLQVQESRVKSRRLGVVIRSNNEASVVYY
jgi:hypothetical protein